MKKITIIILTINALCVMGQLILSTFRSSGGVELATLRSQTERLTRENSQLQSIISEKSSLAAIQIAASNAGYKPIKTISLPPLTVAQVSEISHP